MTVIWYEVLPVTLVSDHAVILRHHEEKFIPPWMIQHLPQVHPNELVVNHLLDFFGEVFEPDQTIVHSTSWRYEDASDRLLLTYLAVLPQGRWVQQWAATKRIFVEHIGAGEIRYGDHLSPPVQIQRLSVLAHALDHLASLSTYDPAIQAVLAPGWRAVLGSRTPKSAGYLQLCPA